MALSVSSPKEGFSPQERNYNCGICIRDVRKILQGDLGGMFKKSAKRMSERGLKGGENRTAGKYGKCGYDTVLIRFGLFLHVQKSYIF